MINMQVRDSYNKIALSREKAEEIWERAASRAEALPPERGSGRNKGGGKKLRRTLLTAAVIASLMTVTALASEFYGFRSLVREEREQLVAREQPDGSLESSTVTVYDIGQTRPYEGPDWAMEWVDKAREAFGEWRSYKAEKLEAYYQEKLPNLKDILNMMDDGGSDYGGVDVQDNGDGTYTFTLWRYEEDPDNLVPDIFGNMVPAYKEVLDPATSVTVDQAEKDAYDAEMLRMATLGGYGDYHYIYGVADAEEAEKLEALAAEYGLSLRSGQVTKYAGDDSDQGLNQSLGQAVGSGDIYREAPEFDHYSTFKSGSFQSAANIPLADGRKLSTYLCSTAYGEMVDGLEVGGFSVREDEPMSTRSYTAADGTELTISQNGSQAIVYAYLDGSYITMTMEINSYRSPGVRETDFSLDEATVNYAADFINYKNIGK